MGRGKRGSELGKGGDVVERIGGGERDVGSWRRGGCFREERGRGKRYKELEKREYLGRKEGVEREVGSWIRGVFRGGKGEGRER